MGRFDVVALCCSVAMSTPGMDMPAAKGARRHLTRNVSAQTQQFDFRTVLSVSGPVTISIRDIH